MHNPWDTAVLVTAEYTIPWIQLSWSQQKLHHLLLLLLLRVTQMRWGFSGVIAVAVYGLYGAATNKWDISLKIEAHGAFDAFWETMAFIVNGIIFFYSGVACINFIVRYMFWQIWPAICKCLLSVVSMWTCFEGMGWDACATFTCSGCQQVPSTLQRVYMYDVAEASKQAKQV